MAKQIEKMSADVELVSKLSDQPNQDNGLTAEELKAVFDRGPKRLKEYVNDTLVPAVNELVESDGKSIKAEQLPEAINTALAQAKESGEFDGKDGDTGGYYTPEITQVDRDIAQVTFTPSDESMPPVAPIYIHLPEGPDGDPGESPTVEVFPITGGNAISFTDANGTRTIKVMDGKDGENGRGIVSIKRKNGNGSPGTTDTYTIVYTDNTSSTFTVYNGKDGKDGDDAYSPSVTITDIDGGHRVTITDKDGTNSFDVMDGKDGEGGGSGGSLMIVYSGQDTTGIATRTSKEIYDHVTAGGRAVWCYRSGEHCGLTLCSEEQVIFTYINPEENLLDGLVIYDDGSYELYENSFVPFNHLDNRLTPIENRLAALENIPNASGVSF